MKDDRYLTTTISNKTWNRIKKEKLEFETMEDASNRLIKLGLKETEEKK